jgi:hypothetical protein
VFLLTRSVVYRVTPYFRFPIVESVCRECVCSVFSIKCITVFFKKVFLVEFSLSGLLRWLFKFVFAFPARRSSTELSPLYSFCLWFGGSSDSERGQSPPLVYQTPSTR